MNKITLTIVGFFGIALFGFQVSRQMLGDDRLVLSAQPQAGFARSGQTPDSGYTLDGTLEPDEIPDFARISNVFRENAMQNGKIYDPDNVFLRVDDPIRFPNPLLGQMRQPTGQTSQPAIQPKTPESNKKNGVSTSTMLSNNDIPLTLPLRFRTEADLKNWDEKYALVQYRIKNRAAKDSAAADSKPAIPAAVESPSVQEIASMNDVDKAVILKKSIRATLNANSKRIVTTQNNTPGDILLMALAYGADAKVYQQTGNVTDTRNKTTPSGSYLYSIGTLCWNYPCSGKTLLRSDGKRVYAKVGLGFQHRPAEFLAMLAMSNIMPNYELKVSNGTYSIGHLIASEKAAVSRGSNMSMTLVGLSFYGGAGDQWKNEMGETWSIERIVTEELNRSIDQGSSDVTDWLLGLTAAIKLHEEEGKTIRGPIALARKQLGTYHDFVLSVQNDQYLWHPKFFLFKGSTPDVYETLYSSGHILRWLLLSLSDKELNDPRVVRAVTNLMSAVNKVPTNTAAGTLTDRQLEGLAVSLHALSIYNLRLFGDEQPEESEKDLAKQ
jgi:hypothetical protein